jgi:uncharacterized membrane protein
MPLLLFIGLATVSYALYDLFASRAGNHIDANLSAIIFNTLGVIVPILGYIFYRYIRKDPIIQTSSLGIIYSILAGVSIGFFSIFLIKAFEKGGVSYVMPLVYGGAIAITAVVGWLIFREPINTLQGIGLVVVVAGIAMIVISRLGVL